jgi:hypothetical protein
MLKHEKSSNELKLSNCSRIPHSDYDSSDEKFENTCGKYLKIVSKVFDIRETDLKLRSINEIMRDDSFINILGKLNNLTQQVMKFLAKILF